MTIANFIYKINHKVIETKEYSTDGNIVKNIPLVFHYKGKDYKVASIDFVTNRVLVEKL